MTALYIIAGIALLIALVLFLPIRLIAGYNKNGILLKVRWLFVTLYDISAPPKKKKKKNKKKQPQSDTQKAQKKSNPFRDLKQSGTEGVPAFIIKLFDDIFSLLGDASRRMKIKSFFVDVRIASEDAAQTAMLYGGICSALYPACSFILGKIKHNIKKVKISACPDFNGSQSQYDVNIVLSCAPYWLLTSASGLLWKLIKREIKVRLNNNLPNAGTNKTNKVTGKEESNHE